VKQVLYIVVLGLLGLLWLPLAAEASSSGDEARLYPQLFGTREAHSTDIGRFYKWTGMLKRWTEEQHLAAGPCTLGQSENCEPREWHRIVELLKPLDLRAKLERVNDLVNHYPYTPSSANWNQPNYWETPFEFLRKSGQCQDYSITKFMLLRAAGVPNDILRIVVLRDMRLRLDHAVLVAYVDGEALMLDNQIAAVTSAASVHHYQPYYSINETGWWLHEPNPLQITSLQ